MFFEVTKVDEIFYFNLSTSVALIKKHPDGTGCLAKI